MRKKEVKTHTRAHPSTHTHTYTQAELIGGKIKRNAIIISRLIDRHELTAY